MTEWEYEGIFGLTEGLINLWWNPKICVHDFKDPPTFQQPVLDWLAAHPEVQYAEATAFGLGPPEWKFPSAELRQEFKDTFLETEERMRELIDAGVAKKKAEEVEMWYAQGKPRDERGVAYVTITKIIGGETHSINALLFPDPETGELKF